MTKRERALIRLATDIAILIRHDTISSGVRVIRRLLAVMDHRDSARARLRGLANAAVRGRLPSERN